MRIGDELPGPDANGSLTGNLYELLVFDNAVDDTDRELLEGYLAHKWGLAAKLPVNHPYKNLAP